VITKYINLLRPLKEATKRLKGRGKSSKYGAIFKVIPVFKYLLSKLKSCFNLYKYVDFNAYAEALEDYVAINVHAA
jgi:hypothetical protein